MNHIMQTFDDEALMAFADGELDPTTVGLVEQALLGDARVAAKVACFVLSAALAKQAVMSRAAMREQA